MSCLTRPLVQICHIVIELLVNVQQCVFLNSLITLAYVTYPDISGVTSYSDQTLIVIKAPPETRLEVPDPTEVSRLGWRCLILL